MVALGENARIAALELQPMKKLSGWQKAGLFAGIGCFSVVALAVLGLVVAVFWARSTLADAGDTAPAKVERTIPLPAASVTSNAPGAPGAPPAGAAEPLRLTIDLEEGNFTIRPGAPGSQVQVQGEFSPSLFALTEERGAEGSGSGTTIRFRSKAPAWVRMLAGIGGSNARPELTVTIPEGAPIDLDLRVAMGQSTVDLGGLSLRDLDVQLSMGEHRLDFSKPVEGELRRAHVDGNMGNISVHNLGNARTPLLEASGNMGNLTADLGGAWEPGTEADFSFSHNMGELVVRVPTGVRLQSDVRREQGQQSVQEADPVGEDQAAPHLRLRVSTSMGQSRVVRY